MRYKRKGNFRGCITEMFNLVTKLRAFKLELFEDILMHLVLISFLAHLSQFKISYNTLEENRTLKKLIAQCVEEEERLKQEKIESAHLESSFGSKPTFDKRKRTKDKETVVHGTSQSKG